MKNRLLIILLLLVASNTNTTDGYLAFLTSHPMGRLNHKFINDYNYAVRYRRVHKLNKFKQILEQEIDKLRMFNETLLYIANKKLEEYVNRIRSKDINELIFLTEDLKDIYLQIPQKFYPEISAKIGLAILQGIRNIIELNPSTGRKIDLFKNAFPAGRYGSELQKLIDTPGFSEVLYDVINLTNIQKLGSLKNYPAEELNVISGFLYEIKFALKLMEKNFQVQAFEPILYLDGQRSEYDILTDIGIFEIKRSDRCEPERMGQLEKELLIAKSNNLNYIYCTINPAEGEDSIRCAINDTQCNLDWRSFLIEAHEIREKEAAKVAVAAAGPAEEEGWIEVKAKPARRAR